MNHQAQSYAASILLLSRPRQILSSGLKVGQVLLGDVMSRSGQKIIAAGTRVTPDLLITLKDFLPADGIQEPILAAG